MSTSAILGVNTSKNKCAIAFFFLISVAFLSTAGGDALLRLERIVRNGASPIALGFSFLHCAALDLK